MIANCAPVRQRQPTIEVPATLIVDGKTYANVGMRFRGNSSLHVPRGKKRSFNVSIDLAVKKQRLLGYNWKQNSTAC